MRRGSLKYMSSHEIKNILESLHKWNRPDTIHYLRQLLGHFLFISEVKNSSTFMTWIWHEVCFIAVNYPPNITTPNQRYALLGEDLELQLEGEDPEERPFVISMMSGSPSGAKLTNQSVLQWRPQSAVKENFYFKATDECNASSTFEMSVEILTCPCTDKGVCLPDPNHPRGSGVYYCKCQPGYEGQRCEREIDECLSNPCVHGRFKLSACYSINSFRQQQHYTITMVARKVWWKSWEAFHFDWNLRQS